MQKQIIGQIHSSANVFSNTSVKYSNNGEINEFLFW